MKAIDFEVTLENTKDDIKKLYTILRPEIKLDTIEYNEFKEGVINSIVLLNDPISNDPIVIRTYMLKMKAMRKAAGKEDLDLEKFQNRKLELAALKSASELGITVELLATYKNGFIYKYVDGDVNDAKLYDLKTTAKKTAIKMAKFHHINLDEIANEKPAMIKFTDKATFANATKGFDAMQKESRHDELRNELPIFSKIEDDYRELHNLILVNDAYGKICFCHNDLNQTNLLIEKSTKQPVFIDFEWSDTNFAMYDIAYHLYNMGGLFCQYFKVENVPNEEFIKEWLKYYYEESNRLDNIEMSNDEFNDFIDNELKKVLINYLLIQFTLIVRAAFFEFGPNMGPQSKKDSTKDYIMIIWRDYLKHRDNYLDLLKTLKK